jgi:hypothetical protein
MRNNKSIMEPIEEGCQVPMESHGERDEGHCRCDTASTTATLSGTCTLGYEWTPNVTNAADGVFHPAVFGGAGSADRMPPGNSSGDPALAYQVTLTNNSASTADVTGFAVVFYTAAGQVEAGSDKEQVSDTFITPGHTLSWAVIEGHTVHGYGDDPNEALLQTGNIPAVVTSCQFLQWYAGSGS